VYCQLEVLRHCFPSSVRQILADLPESLDGTYERILQQIPKSNRTHAHRLLQCLTVAVRPLLLEELAEVLAVDFPEGVGIPKFNESFRWEGQEQAVLSACSSFITVVEERRRRSNTITVHFSHFSVKEFLTSDRLAASTTDGFRSHHIRLGPAHTIMAQACLSVLLCLTKPMDWLAIDRYHLAKYAAKHFHEHANFEDVLSRIIDGVDDLLDPEKPHFDTWLWLQIHESNSGNWRNDHLPPHCFDARISSRRRSTSLVYLPRIAPLYYVAALGHICFAQRLVLTRPQDLHARDDRGRTSLHIAVLAGQIEVSKLFIGHAADLGVLDTERHNLLHMAAYNPHFEITRILLEHDWATKAHINARNKNGQTPLHLASQYHDRYGHGLDCNRPSIVALLLKFGADVDAQDNDNMTPLHCTIEHSIQSDAVTMQVECEGRHGDRRLRWKNDGPPLELRWHPSSVAESFYLGQWVMNTQEYDDMSSLVCTSGYFKSGSAAQPLLEHGASVHARNKDGRTPLHLASKHELYDVVALLMKFGADVDAQDNNEMTPLHCVIESYRSLVAAQLLLDHGASIHLRNKKGETPLHLASRRGLSDVAAFLLKSGADVDSRDNENTTPLLCASENSDAAVAQLLEHGASVNVRDKNGQTPLHLVSRRGLSGAVAFLLKSGADVDPRDNDNKTPLLCASENSRNGEVARLLLEHGASVNVRGKDGQTPLHLALQRHFSDVVLLLLKWGADVDAHDICDRTPLLCAKQSFERVTAVQLLPDHMVGVHVRHENGQTPLHLASRHDFSDVAALLLKLGADVDALDNDRMTPLLCALKFSKRGEAAQVLLEHGASVQVRDKDGQTLLHLALQRRLHDVHELLLGFGPDVNARDNDNMTPLLYAIELYQSFEASRLIKDHGASVHLRNKNGQTPLHLAVQRHLSDVVTLLIKSGSDVDAPDNDNITPLLYTPQLSDRDAAAAAQLLLEHGASVHVRDKDGQTALHRALRRDLSDLVALLLQSGADVDAQDNDGMTLLLQVVQWGKRAATVQLLLEHGASVHLQNKDGLTPLHFAVTRDRSDVVALLLQFGAPVDALDNNNMTPLCSLRFSGDVTTATILLQHGASVHIRNKNGQTPLHFGSRYGPSGVVALLLKSGADVDAQDDNGATPLHFVWPSSSQGNFLDDGYEDAEVELSEEGLEVIAMLLEYGANVRLQNDHGKTPLQVASARERQQIEELFVYQNRK